MILNWEYFEHRVQLFGDRTKMARGYKAVNGGKYYSWYADLPSRQDIEAKFLSCVDSLEEKILAQ